LRYVCVGSGKNKRLCEGELESDVGAYAEEDYVDEAVGVCRVDEDVSDVVWILRIARGDD
jgi:hypothetical protein